jgi:hypothetical protein
VGKVLAQRGLIRGAIDATIAGPRTKQKYDAHYLVITPRVYRTNPQISEKSVCRKPSLANARAGQSRVEELRARKWAMLDAYAQGISYDGVYWLPPELKHEIYYALRLKVTVHADALEYDAHVNPTVIKLTRAVEEYGHEVEQYRGLLRSSSITDSDLREINNIMQGAVPVGEPSPQRV